MDTAELGKIKESEPKPEEVKAAEPIVDRADKKFDHVKKDLENASLEWDNKARPEYASKLFKLIVGWIIAILLIIVGVGFKWVPLNPVHPVVEKSVAIAKEPLEYHWEFRLSDPVLLGLIGGTTANIIGLFIVVANHIFPKRDQK